MTQLAPADKKPTPKETQVLGLRNQVVGWHSVSLEVAAATSRRRSGAGGKGRTIRRRRQTTPLEDHYMVVVVQTVLDPILVGR